jgi:threonine dehydrogenase-like Zn-dependent dehydrogenase
MALMWLATSMASWLLVIGQRPVGQLAARIALLRGAEKRGRQKPAPAERTLCKRTRYDVSVVPLSEQTNTPFDIIIEASGSMQALQSCHA